MVGNGWQATAERPSGEAATGSVTLQGMIEVLKGTFSALPEAVIVAAPDRRIAWANRSAETMFGHPLRTLFGRTTEFLYASPEGYRATGRAQFRPGAPGTAPHYGIAYRRANGEIFGSETTGTQITAPDGTLLGYIGIIRDVSQAHAFYDTLTTLQALASDQRSTREEKIEAILTLGIGHFGMTAGAVAERDTKAPAGLGLRRVIGAEGPAMLERLRALDTRAAGRPLHDCADANGAFIAAPLIVDGEDVGMIAFVSDNARGPFAKSELDIMGVLAMKVSYKLANIAIMQRLEAARRQAETANIAKSRFLAGLSHDLRTPFAGMLGMLDLLDAEEDPATREEMTGHIRRATETLMDLLNDALDLAQIEQGALRLREEAIDLARLAADSIAPFAPLAAQREVAIRATVGPGVPRAVLADPLRLRQVLNNLLSNAVKYTEAGAITLTVGLEAGVLSLTVADTGIGVPEHRQSAIFGAFEQADEGTARLVGGAGLGLALSRRLARAMGGDITLHSTMGEGSRFAFTLPCRPAPDSDSTAVSGDLGTLMPRRILLAEDNATISLLLTRMLGRLGHRVHHVSDGAAAINAARSEVFDIAVLDRRMPRIDGLMAAGALRGRAAGGPLPVIILTAEALQGQATVRGHPAVADCLTKPIDWKALEAAIQRHARHAPDAASAAG